MEKCSVSLVLGSGGARGLAHIGVIQWLNDHGFQIRSIAGTSMGALVGGIYATGNLDAYIKWVCALEKIDIIKLLDFNFSRTSLLKGERVINVIKELIGDHIIEDLDIAFTAVATELNSGKEVWLNSGSLFNAIQASIAIPTIFAPYEYNGKNLVDGTLVNPIPIAPTLRDATDITIVVNLSAKPNAKFNSKHINDKINNDSKNYRTRILSFIDSLQKKRIEKETEDLGFFDIISQSIEIMQNSIAQFRLAAYRPEFVIDIPSNVCAFYEFHRAREMIAFGRKKASEILENRISELCNKT